MKTTITLLFLHIMSLAHANVFNRPVQSTSTVFFAESQPQKVIIFNDCSIQKNRVLLNWTVENNQNADKFEIEKSNDGKTFKIAALVFGTDKPDSDRYQFYEKAKSHQIYYRIKILYKDNSTAYSDIITIKANNKISSN